MISCQKNHWVLWSRFNTDFEDRLERDVMPWIDSIRALLTTRRMTMVHFTMLYRIPTSPDVLGHEIFTEISSYNFFI